MFKPSVNHSEIAKSLLVVTLKFTPAKLMPHPIEQWWKSRQYEQSEMSTSLIDMAEEKSTVPIDTTEFSPFSVAWGFLEGCPW